MFRLFSVVTFPTIKFVVDFFFPSSSSFFLLRLTIDENYLFWTATTTRKQSQANFYDVGVVAGSLEIISYLANKCALAIYLTMPILIRKHMNMLQKTSSMYTPIKLALITLFHVHFHWRKFRNEKYWPNEFRLHNSLISLRWGSKQPISFKCVQAKSIDSVKWTIHTYVI